MREIKFRGQGIENKKFIHGNLLIYNKQCHIPPQKYSSKPYGSFEVIPDSVGEFIGLKDKNGVDIYEGDILEAYNDSLSIIETKAVVFENATFSIGRYWKDGTHDWYSMEQYDSFELEVIGNIHENKELLNK